MIEKGAWLVPNRKQYYIDRPRFSDIIKETQLKNAALLVTARLTRRLQHQLQSSLGLLCRSLQREGLSALHICHAWPPGTPPSPEAARGIQPRRAAQLWAGTPSWTLLAKQQRSSPAWPHRHDPTAHSSRRLLTGLIWQVVHTCSAICFDAFLSSRYFSALWAVEQCCWLCTHYANYSKWCFTVSNVLAIPLILKPLKRFHS